MWVNKQLFDMIVEDNGRQEDKLVFCLAANATMQGAQQQLHAQKAKDDVTIDWMRHRINTLEKQNALLMQKAAGIFMPVPEIVPSQAGQMSVPNFDSMPSFEDCGDTEASRYGIAHDEDGGLVYTK